MRNTIVPVGVAPAVGVTLNFSVRSVWSLSLATVTVTFVPSGLRVPTESGVISGAQLASVVAGLGSIVISYVPAFVNFVLKLITPRKPTRISRSVFASCG